jgi:hypothetical protein
MSTSTNLYAFLLRLTILPAGYLISLLWNYRSQPGGRWFILALIGGTGWSVCWALMLLFDGYTLSLFFFNLVILSVAGTSLSILFVAIEYLWRTRIGYRVVVRSLLSQ